MTRATSKRAEVLRRVLRYLNDDNYLDSGEQLWFGCEPDEGLDKTEKFFLEFHREIADYASVSGQRAHHPWARARNFQSPQGHPRRFGESRAEERGWIRIGRNFLRTPGGRLG